MLTQEKPELSIVFISHISLGTVDCPSRNITEELVQMSESQLGRRVGLDVRI